MLTGVSVNGLYYHAPGAPMIPTANGSRSSLSVIFDMYGTVETAEMISQGQES